ncbi:hypothetical protein [Pedobacter hiemivivus]|uniref:hypothetical protein n=1 Tax=Pedobacter hiemivivus TaxID=2530454 RepID=UPI0013F1581D|nr:hypothetical protein [Pedobacter hiemivivus]
MRATWEMGYVIPNDNDLYRMVCVQHHEYEQIYPVDDLNYDEEQNNSSGFF